MRAAAGDVPAKAGLRRLRHYGIRPSRDLGQNFLIDSNLLGVIGRAAQLDRNDVVLEIGGGLGVLSEYLAPLVGHLHVVEVDERLRVALEDAVSPFANVTVWWADAMTLALVSLNPAPTRVVANLPYGIAAGVLLRTMEELPGVTHWVAMVQREVGERLAAAPGRGAYGATSVLAQLVGDVRVLRAVPRSVFLPVPNVDSVLVEIRRHGPGAPRALRELVHDAFAHRRKALAGSLALAAAADRRPPPTRAVVRRALVELGRPPDARAETLTPAQFRALAELLGR